MPTPKPKTRQPSRAKRWEALDDLAELQLEYEEWRENLPESLEDSRTAELLDGIIELELEEARDCLQEAVQAVASRGFGRD